MDLKIKRPFSRKTTLQRFVESVEHPLDTASGVKRSLSDVNAGKAAKTGAIAAGALAGLTAGSAAVSSARRRFEQTRNGSRR